MEITEEQLKRAEANRLAALAKRKALMDSSILQQQQQRRQEHNHQSSILFKCPKFCNERNPTIHQISKPALFEQFPDTHLPDKFRVRLEICSPNSFSATPMSVQGFTYPGHDECSSRLSDLLSSIMPSHYTQCHGGGKSCVYKLEDYDSVLKCLKRNKVDVEEIPWGTRRVLEKLSQSYAERQWIPFMPEHLPDDKVDDLIAKLPKKLVNTLLPFQLDGVRFGLRRGGRCLIADEMGLGKTIQAIAVACCFMSKGSILVVCPAVLRYSWAEELEHWASCLPSDIHLVFSHQNNPVHLKRRPRVVVISYRMLHHLRDSMLQQEWALLIVDESHQVRCSKKASEPGEVQAVLDVAAKVERIVLLSGTPSLTRPYDIFHQVNMLWPGLLGTDKYHFAKIYCNVKHVQGFEGRSFQDFSRGTRLEELNVLLRETVMIRRLKEHVLVQLPPKRRQIIRVSLKRSDIISAKATVAVSGDASKRSIPEGPFSEDLGEADDRILVQQKLLWQCLVMLLKEASRKAFSEDLGEADDHGVCSNRTELSYQECGIAKLSGFCEWLSLHFLMAEADGVANFDSNCSSFKMIIFAHHHKVLDAVQEFVCKRGIAFVCIDGTTLARDRKTAVESFQSSSQVKIAIIGITAGGVGLDLSSAQHVVFLELPQSPSLMLQAEDRAHRRGQKKAVNIYIFCAKDTLDELHWQKLNTSLSRVSSTMNGKYEAVREIEVDGVFSLETFSKTDIHKHQNSGYLSAEHQKFIGCGFSKDKKSSMSCNKLAGKLTIAPEEPGDTDDSPIQNDNNLIGAHIASGSEFDLESASEVKLEGKKFESKLRNAEVYLPKFNDVSISKNEDELEMGDRFNCQITEPLDAEPLQMTANHTNLLLSLRFEVSQYTGRIHLYSCVLGTDSRPTPLFESFRPDELGKLHSCAVGNEKILTLESPKDNPAIRNSVLEFIKDWTSLRAVDQKKLIGKPLQLPLAVELCYLNETINHDKGGLLKGGSKRRTTPFSEVSKPLPSNAVWKEVQLQGKKDKKYTQAWTLADQPLCKLCHMPCKNSNAKTPEFLEDLFCDLDCYEEYRVRTSSRFLRQELFQLENGVCVVCQLDCHKLVKHLRPLSETMRRDYIEKTAPKVAKGKKLLDKLIKDPTEGNAWHADHIIPVYQGGGECRLENMRTLCVACHYDVTKAQYADRRSTRIKAKKQLKAVMSDLRALQNVESRETNVRESECLKVQESVTMDDELLVNVPGSVYCSENDLNAGKETK